MTETPLQIEPLSAIAPRQSATTSVGGVEGADFQNFLRLLTAQLRNQDPLSPLDSTQFVAQLASFSTVEQLVTANARLEDISARLNDADFRDYAAWIGRTAAISGLPARFEGEPIEVLVEPQPGSVKAELVARTADGAQASRIAVPLTGGAIEWAPSTATPGELYHFDIEHSFSDGSSITVRAAVYATVNGLRLTAEGIVLDLSNGLSAPATLVRGLGQ